MFFVVLLLFICIVSVKVESVVETVFPRAMDDFPGLLNHFFDAFHRTV